MSAIFIYLLIFNFSLISFFAVAKLSENFLIIYKNENIYCIIDYFIGACGGGGGGGGKGIILNIFNLSNCKRKCRFSKIQNSNGVLGSWGEKTFKCWQTMEIILL